MRRARRAHPRSRGENDDRHFEVERGHGSSPLTRGKLVVDGHRPLPPRLIPAHAGKTFGFGEAFASEWAHPRSRGENKKSDHTDPGASGSSPLTRGKPASSRLSEMRSRLIPAHAGKTYQRSHRSHEPWAHPRSRGENPTFRRLRVSSRGSSPLTRGKRTRLRQ